ncbi:hypothetical protein PIIN_01860 [Serendipita indica DSM 11827]|uniref:Uncharacterized protein n=1 Tax=Serendipita indica (strain DSM 11827) TaxID=1109443 RepID=G4T9K7_SERID|nr:hypothetical protein PIIN_01860 [Serendipita indica DSM 11827]
MSLRNGIRRLKAATLPTDAPTMCCGDATTLYGTRTITTTVPTAYATITSLKPFASTFSRTYVNCVSSSNGQCVSSTVSTVWGIADYFFGLNVTTTVTGAVPVVTSVVVPTATTTVPCSKRDISDEGEELLKRNAAQPPLRIATKTGLALGALVLSAFVLV